MKVATAWTFITIVACIIAYETFALPYELGLEDGLNACPQQLEPTYQTQN